VASFEEEPGARRFVSETSFGFQKRLRFVLAHLARERDRSNWPLRVLDVGCGTGSLLTLPLAQEGYQVVGLDVHLPSLQHGRRSTLKGLSFVCGSPEAFPSETFDIAICSEVLEHVGEPEEFLSSVVRVLRGGGLCLVTVPNGFGPYEQSQKVLRFVRPWANKVGRLTEDMTVDASVVHQSLNFSSGHIQFYSEKALERLCTWSGLVVEDRRNRTFLCGFLLSEAIESSSALVEWNASLADALPLSWGSGWMFALRKPASGEGRD
jgi:SAM-dependent methyltransferase